MIDIDHHLTVARLRELLALLQDDDELWPNEVKNLAVERKGEYIGYISFRPPGDMDVDGVESAT